MNHPPGWFPDPSAPHRLRWWDGARWTEHVSDAGVHGVDPPTPPPRQQPTSSLYDTLSAALRGHSALAAGIAVLLVVAIAAGVTVGRVTGTSPVPTAKHLQTAAPTATATPDTSTPTPTETTAPTPSPTAAQPSTPAGLPEPELTLDPPPPAGYTGIVEVLSAQGTGSTETPVFATRGTHLSGGMQVQKPGASWWLVPDGTTFDSSKPPTASCLAPSCGSGGWQAVVPVGRYRLVTDAAPEEQWSFTLDEQVQPPLSFSVLTPPPGATGPVPVVRTAGVGNQQTPVFHLSTSSLNGVMTNHGVSSRFWLVPAGQGFNPAAKPTATCSSGCAEGGWSATVAPGDWYLVVRADDTWSFEVDITAS